MTETEEWRPIATTDGRYDVSSLGRVRSNGWSIVTASGQRRRVPPRVLSAKPSHEFGYVQVNLRLPNGRVWHAHVHILVLTAFAGSRPVGFYACHNNGDPADNRAANLRWDTPSGNSADKALHGTDHNSKKTHCGACGLEYTPENTYLFGPGHKWRRCKNCSRRYARTTYHRTKQRKTA